ncbi:MAG: hypothetical protein JWP34_5100 [Massilia sp.]|nr:hypothetical protein [Massilia sp.]
MSDAERSELRCSECNRLYTDPSCGLLHSITFANIGAIRLIASRLFGTSVPDRQDDRRPPTQ